MHLLDIGIHECEQDNTAGVICLNISPSTVTNFNTAVTSKNRADITILFTTLTNTSVTNKSGVDTKVIVTKVSQFYLDQ